MPSFEFEEGTSRKFWEVSVEGASLTTRWGKLGTTGQQKTQVLGDAAAAVKEHDKLIASKLKKGYRAVGAAAAAKPTKATPAASVKLAASPSSSGKYNRIHRIALPQSPYALATSADGRWVASACFDQKLRVYEAATMTEAKVLHLGTSFPHSAFFSGDSQTVFAGAKSIQGFAVAGWKKGVALKGHKQETQRSVLAPSGHAWTVSGEFSTPADWSVRKWDLATGKELLRVKLEAPLYGLDASPEGGDIVCGDRNGTITRLAGATGKVVWSSKPSRWAYVTLFSADGSEVFVGDAEERELTVLDAATGEKKRTLPLGGLVRDVQRLPGGRLLAGVNDWRDNSKKTTLRVIDASTGAVAWSSEPLGKMTQAVASSPDGRTLYAHTSDENALWVFAA